MSVTATPQRPRLSTATCFARASGGTALVEFAFILPLCLTILMGLIDFTRAFNERKRVTLISSSLAEMVSQQQTTDALAPAALNSTVIASTAIMTPYPAGQLAVTVSAVQLTANSDGTCCRAKVQWSFTRGGVLRPCNVILAQVPAGAPTAPDNILASMLDPSLLANAASAQLIVADVVDPYKPLFGEFASLLTGATKRTSYRSLRSWGTLNLLGGATAPTGAQAKVCFVS